MGGPAMAQHTLKSFPKIVTQTMIETRITKVIENLVKIHKTGDQKLLLDGINRLVKFYERVDTKSQLDFITQLGKTGKLGAIVLVEIFCNEIRSRQIMEPGKYDTFYQAFRKIGKDAVPALIDATTDRNQDIRSQTAALLGISKDPKAFDRLADMVFDPDSMVRIYVTKGLRVTEDNKATPILIGMLMDPDMSVRISAVKSLEDLGDPRALDALRRCARSDPSIEVKKEARIAIKSINEDLQRELKDIRISRRPFTEMR